MSSSKKTHLPDPISYSRNSFSPSLTGNTHFKSGNYGYFIDAKKVTQVGVDKITPLLNLYEIGGSEPGIYTWLLVDFGEGTKKQIFVKKSINITEIMTKHTNILSDLFDGKQFIEPTPLASGSEIRVYFGGELKKSVSEEIAYYTINFLSGTFSGETIDSSSFPKPVQGSNAKSGSGDMLDLTKITNPNTKAICEEFLVLFKNELRTDDIVGFAKDQTATLLSSSLFKGTSNTNGVLSELNSEIMELPNNVEGVKVYKFNLQDREEEKLFHNTKPLQKALYQATIRDLKTKITMLVEKVEKSEKEGLNTKLDSGVLKLYRQQLVDAEDKYIDVTSDMIAKYMIGSGQAVVHPPNSNDAEKRGGRKTKKTKKTKKKTKKTKKTKKIPRL